MQIDLEPQDYSVKGRKEPILNKGWWITLLIFFAIVTFGAVVIRPNVAALHNYLMSL
jgi:hypothetical protein